MPTYEYECESCGHFFEEFQKMTDEPVKECPVCGGKVRRVISGGSGVIYKGSGFYATDYKKDQGGQAGQGGGRFRRSPPGRGMGRGRCRGRKVN
jgi:putative FmdB family regulatory protein